MVGSDSLSRLSDLDLAVLEGDVEVDAHDDALAGDGEILDEEFLPGAHGAGLAELGAGCRRPRQTGPTPALTVAQTARARRARRAAR